MNSNYLHITLLVDRSGSMFSTKNDASGGINSLLKEQREKDYKCTVSLYQFDDQFEQVYNLRDISNVLDYELQPRGGTALLDAAYKAIVSTGEDLAKIPEALRPSRVFFVVVTDGEENSSKEVTKQRLKELVKQQETTYKWEFIFIGANVDAFTEGHSLGFASNIQYFSSPVSTRSLYSNLSSSITESFTANIPLCNATNYTIDINGNKIDNITNTTSDSTNVQSTQTIV